MNLLCPDGKTVLANKGEFWVELIIPIFLLHKLPLLQILLCLCHI